MHASQQVSHCVQQSVEEAERCELRLPGGLSGSTGSDAWEVGKWEVFSAGQG